MAYPQPYLSLLDEVGALLTSEPRREGAETARALLATPQPTQVKPEPPCLFDAAIQSCLDGSDDPLARALLAAQDLLPWGVNPVSDRMTPDAAAMIAVLTLMGPEGPVPSPFFRLGFVYMAPWSYYPLHNHDADETYVVLAGRALWTAGDDTRERGAGSMVHHPSLMAHAFRTYDEGFVALWRWSGDINTESYTFLPDPQIIVA